MKNLIIGPAFPLRGGIANFNEALCKAFNKAGVNSKIISFSLQYPDFLFPGKTQYDTGKGPEDVAIETLINSVNPFNWYKVARKIRREKPDYIILRFWIPFMAPCLGTIARLVRRNTNIKVIAITDNIIPHEKKIADRFLTGYFVRSCDAFVAMSDSVYKDINSFTANKNKLFVPHPIYDIFGEKVLKADALDYLNLKKTDKHILFFGFIRKYKGLDLLLEAMADKRIRDIGLKLIVAGEFYEDRTFYDTIISKHHLEDSIILRTEYIPSPEVKQYFCAADMIVQTYKTATQSGVTQIAYHFERPMLVTNVGGLAEIVPDGKVGYVTATDPKAIADALVDFYTNNREEEFASHTKIEKARFQWTTMVEGIEKLFSSLKA